MNKSLLLPFLVFVTIFSFGNILCLSVFSGENTATNNENKKTELKDTYYLKPKLVERGEIKVVGLGDLFVNYPSGQVGVETKGRIIDLYKRLYKYKISNIVDGDVNIGVETYPSLPSFMPYPSLQYHMATYEVTEFLDVAEDLKAVKIPASKYAVVSCEAPVDSQTKIPLKSVDYNPLWDGSAKWRNESGKIIIDDKVAKEKGYILEVFYFWHDQVLGIQEYGGFPLYKYELWTAIE